ncbi:DMT family transporter [Paenibacillus sp. IB182363]|uniref:DMT family transporter n=2 Tax=Paenibacillus oceani TaxID=2772510 RepID=A0A927GX61_9BACL|nr:DMT family transporter [Paenibacillus oceani]
MARSYLLLLVCVTIWGSNFVFGAILVDHFPPMLLSVSRLLLTSSVYVVMAMAARRFEWPVWKDWKLLLPLGAANALNQICFYTGMQDADPTTSSLLLSLSPIMIGLLAPLFLSEKITLRMGIGSAIALSGVFFVVGKGGSIHLSAGELWIVGAMLTFVASTILTRKLMERRDAFFVTSYATVSGTAMLIPVALLREDVSGMSTELWAWTLLIASAFLMQVVCGLVWNRQMQIVGAGKAAVFLNLQPFVAMSLGYVILGTAVSLKQGFGSLLIIGGVLLATSIGRNRPRSRPRPAEAGEAAEAG